MKSMASKGFSREKLHQRLRRLREAAGLTQSELAKAAGVSRNAVSQWEAGVTQPSARRLMSVAKALKTQVDDLLAAAEKSSDEILEVAATLLRSRPLKDLTLEAIAEAADLAVVDLQDVFPRLDDLLHELFDKLIEDCLTALRAHPPAYGSLKARLKYLFRIYSNQMFDSYHLAVGLQQASWTWDEMREREFSRRMLEFHDLIIGLFDEAAAGGEIRHGNYRAASGMLLAAHAALLRQSGFGIRDPHRLITQFEPQIDLVLQGFEYRPNLGMAEEEPQ